MITKTYSAILLALTLIFLLAPERTTKPVVEFNPPVVEYTEPIVETPPPPPPQATAPITPAEYVPTGYCEEWRPLVAQYDWNVDTALFVMYKESSCDPNAQSPTNDSGLFQLHDQAVYDPAENVAIAYQKYVNGRVGEYNFSAWYAVCTPGNNPQPKYDGIKCT